MVGILARMTGATLSKTCSPALWLWTGGFLFVGPSLRLDRHSGAVPCLVVGLDADLGITVGGHPAVNARSVLIPPRLPHHLDAGEGRIASCYLDPASPASAACRRSMSATRRRLAIGHTAQDELIELGHTLDRRAGPELARQWLSVAAPDRAAPGGEADRVDGVLASIMENPAPNWRAGECARLVGLSESAFLRLFTAETGTSFRRYRLWARMLRACRVIAEGGNLTRAAAESGFATPSHLSSAFHTLFGLTPTRLLNTGITIVAVPGPDTPRVAWS